MEIISLFVVLSIIVCVFALGVATVRLIQADDPGVEKKKKHALGQRAQQ